MRKGDGATRISGETAGGSGRRCDCGPASAADPPRQPAARRRMVHSRRHAGIGRDVRGGVRRELAEETGLEVRVLEFIEVFERIFRTGMGERNITS